MIIEILSQIIISILTQTSTLLEAKIAPQYFTRNRKYSFVDLCYFLIWHRKRSTQSAIFLFTDLKLGYEKFKACSEQAISAARQHMNETPFIKCFKAIRDFEYGQENRMGLKKYFNLFLIALDGSKSTLPNETQPREDFGVIKGSPKAQISLGFDVLNNRILGGAIGKCFESEREQAKAIIRDILNIIPACLCCFIFDRGYPAEWLIKFLQERKAHYVMRVRSQFNVRIDLAPMGSSLVELSPGLEVRVVKFKLNTGKVETLITDLTFLPVFALKKIYSLRWGVETEYDKLKNKLELCNYTGYTKLSILQDFWITVVLAYLAAVTAETATVEIQKMRKNHNNKYLYKADISRVVTAVWNFLTPAIFTRKKLERKKLFDKLLRLSEKQPIPIRPGRNVPRKRNSRKARYHHNRKSS